MNVEREVARSVFPRLSGAITDVKRYEKSKNFPDQEKIIFYELASKAMWSRHAKFWKFTEDDVQDVFKNISPILKAMTLSSDKQSCEKIIEANKFLLLELIKLTGVSL